MKSCMSVLFFSVCVLSAQTPNLSGVWKANLEKSKLNGPAPTSHLVLIDQQGSKITEVTGMFSQRGEARSTVVYNLDGKPSTNSSRGLPMRSSASWEGNTLVLQSKVAGGAQPVTISEKQTLSSDGKTLTIEAVSTANGKDTAQTLVLEKQPDSAGEPLRKPEETAGARFKNVQLLKDLPASQLLDSMRAFNMSLGVNCEQCHVQGNFAADEKPAKLMARKMITMTRTINDQTFAGKNEVRCYTCHRGQVDPQNRPAF
jgi:hypothetical protein